MHDSVSVFDPAAFLGKVGDGRSNRTFTTGQAVFTQGGPADSVFFLQCGKIKLSLLSPQGKEAVIGILGVNDFFGDGCLAGQRVRMCTATALSPCSVTRVERSAMVRALADHPEFAGTFIVHLLSRNIRMEEDLTDQLFNSSEKRLARVLLLLANFGKEGLPEPVIPNMSQQTLADMIGTTRSRVCFFMNKFRRLGFIEYNGGLHVHSSLLNVILHE